MDSSDVHYNTTGTTGGPGSQGDPTTLSTNSNQHIITLGDIVQNMRKENVEAFVGATGGVGGIPIDDNGHLTINPTPEIEDMSLAALNATINNATCADDLLTLLDKEVARCNVAISKANAIAGKHGYIVGSILVKQESFIRNDATKSWEGYCEESEINKKIKLRSRQYYMSMARIPGVTKYLFMGIEKLGKLGSILSKIEGLDPKDPIGSLMSTYDISADSAYEEVLEKINATVTYARLESQGLKVNKDVILKFVEAGHKLEGRDNKALKAIKATKGDLNEYFLSSIKNDGKRPGDETENNPKLPNIHEQAQILLDTVNKFIELPKIEMPIEVTRIDDLIKGLETLKQKLANQS